MENFYNLLIKAVIIKKNSGVKKVGNGKQQPINNFLNFG